MPLCEYDMNPDEDFVLHGRPAPIYWARPRYLTNSELTTTTLNADGAPAFSSSKLLDAKSVSFQNGLEGGEGHLRQHQHQQEHGDLRRTTSTLAESLTDNELVRTGSSFARESRSRTRSLRGLPASSSEASWYTRLRNAPLADGVRSLSPAPITRTVGSLGAKLLATKEVEREMEEDRRNDRELLEAGHYTRHDDLARRYFPVTLGASFDLGRHYREGEVRSPPPEVTRSRSRSRSRTRDDGRYVKVSTSTNGVRQSLATPYELELGRLRMERLRIEEERLLELKRQEELERTRGPKPRWYELKNTDFHIEANRNNTLLRNEEYWDDMLKYRSQLSNASKEFRRSWDGVALY